MENTEEQKKPLFASTRLGRIVTKRNIVIFALLVIVFDIALTHYFFNSRQRALFLSATVTAAREADAPVSLGELTRFEWAKATIAPKGDGVRFWFTTYESRTYLFDYILDYGAEEIRVEAAPGTVYTPDSKFTIQREGAGVRMRPAE